MVLPMDSVLRTFGLHLPKERRDYLPLTPLTTERSPSKTQIMKKQNGIMKNRWKYILMLLFPVWMLAACSDDEVAPPSVTLSGNGEDILVATAAGSTTLQFTANRDWTVSASSETGTWCRVSPSSGLAGTATVTVTFDENISQNDRTATIVVRAGDQGETPASASVKLVQKQKDAIILSKSAYELDYEETKLEFDVVANVKFDVKVSVDWIKQNTEGRAVEVYPLSFDIEANESAESREGVITVTFGELKQEVKVLQYGKPSQGRIAIVHSNWNFVVPLITGRNLEGTVFWGDGQQEAYTENLTHTFGEQKEYTTVIEMLGADAVTLNDLVEVTEIDLSEF